MRNFLILLIFAVTNTFAQPFSGTITDRKTNHPLQYTTIYNISTKIGTVTNAKGQFLLQNTRLGDTIKISYIGYQNKTVVISATTKKSIQLIPKDEILSEITVLADNEYLYDLISKIRKTG